MLFQRKLVRIIHDEKIRVVGTNGTGWQKEKLFRNNYTKNVNMNYNENDSQTTRYKNNQSIIFTHSWRETDEFMPFPRALLQREKQIVSSMIWTQVANSISYNDNRYTKCTTCILEVSLDLSDFPPS